MSECAGIPRPLCSLIFNVSAGAYRRAPHRHDYDPRKCNQIVQAELYLLDVIFDRFNRIGQIKRIMFCLLGLDEDNEHIKPIARRRVAFGVH
jgi:hypothetical protein